MVLLEIDPQDPTIAPFERDAPGAVDVDRVASRPAAQRVEVKARLPKRVERRRAVDRRQAHQSSVLQIGSHAGASAGLEELSQPAVPKAFNHRRYVKRDLTSDVKSHLTREAPQG